MLAGSSQEAYALKQKIPSGQLVRVPDIQAGIAAVAEAAPMPSSPASSASRNPKRRAWSASSTPVRRRRHRLRLRKDDAPRAMPSTRGSRRYKADGKMKRLYVDKYGFNNWDLLARIDKATDLVPDCK